MAELTPYLSADAAWSSACRIRELALARGAPLTRDAVDALGGRSLDFEDQEPQGQACRPFRDLPILSFRGKKKKETIFEKVKFR